MHTLHTRMDKDFLMHFSYPLNFHARIPDNALAPKPNAHLQAAQTQVAYLPNRSMRI
jgi:hypothetical protein